MILADKIIALRKKNGWSQEELAQQVNVSRQAVSKWEGAQSIPDLDKILTLARVFGVSTDYLLKDEMEAEEYVTDSMQETETQQGSLRRVSMGEAIEFLQIKSETAGWIAFATFLCILSPVGLLFLGAASETGVLPISENMAGGLGIILLLVLVAAAVAVFIICGMQTSRFEYLEREPIETEYGVCGMVQERKKEYQGTYTRFNVFGTCLCILAAVPLFACVAFFEDNDFFMAICVCILLALVGVAVIFFITAGINWASMQKLLQEGDYSVSKKRGGALTEIVGRVYWLLVTAGFLAYSFSTGNWKNSWIIWPVAGVIFAAVAAVCEIIEKSKKGKRKKWSVEKVSSSLQD